MTKEIILLVTKIILFDKAKGETNLRTKCFDKKRKRNIIKPTETREIGNKFDLREAIFNFAIDGM